MKLQRGERHEVFFERYLVAFLKEELQKSADSAATGRHREEARDALDSLTHQPFYEAHL